MGGFGNGKKFVVKSRPHIWKTRTFDIEQVDKGEISTVKINDKAAVWNMSHSYDGITVSLETKVNLT